MAILTRHPRCAVEMSDDPKGYVLTAADDRKLEPPVNQPRHFAASRPLPAETS